MDPRLEHIDRLLAVLDNSPEEGQIERELAFALLSIDKDDPATLRWAAAMLAARAQEIEDEGGEEAP